MRAHTENLTKNDSLNKTSSDCENKSNTSGMSSNSQSNLGLSNVINSGNSKAGTKPISFDTSLLGIFCRTGVQKEEKSPQQLSATMNGQDANNIKKVKVNEEALRRGKKPEKGEGEKNLVLKNYKDQGDGFQADIDRSNVKQEKITSSGKIKKTNLKADNGGSNILKALNQKKAEGLMNLNIVMGSRERKDEKESNPNETHLNEEFKTNFSLGSSYIPQNLQGNLALPLNFTQKFQTNLLIQQQAQSQVQPKQQQQQQQQHQQQQQPQQQQQQPWNSSEWKGGKQNCFPRDLCEIMEDNENDIEQKKALHEAGPFVSRPVFNQPPRAAGPNYHYGVTNSFIDSNSQTPYSTPRLQKNVVPYSAMGKRESIVSTDSNHDSDNLTTNHTLNALNNSAFNNSLKLDGDSSYENSARKKSIPTYPGLNNQNCYLSNSAHKDLFSQQIFLPSRDSPSQNFLLQEDFPNLSFMGINPASISRRTSTTTMEGEPKSASTRGDLNSSYMSKASSEDRMNLNNSLRQSNEEYPFDNFVIDLTRIEADGRTTLMIKNIPNKYHLDLMLQTINKNHKNRYDFFYLPIDFRNNCNVGYAFINFVDTRFIRAFVTEFDGQKWSKFNSEKICSIRYARIQGRQALIQHFQYSSVMNQQDRKLRPLILPKNERNNIEMLVQKQKMRNMEEYK